MKKVFKIAEEKDLIKLIRQIIKSYNQKIFIIRGQLGVGKTTFIKYFCLELGVKDVVTSPTFSLVNEYLIDSKKKVFHFDFYRLESTQEIIDIGFEMYLNSENYCFIEWPELAIDLLPENILSLSIDYMDNDRLVTIF
tara:strand:- start:104 stop:517 length:414 start_codon:yes stop_codon:yes gene_type:complete